ncbi:MAG: segregation/condensation protein A [Defluviitaleaceae bacterium]|nr:segregation/condensation protein A [Defluviitaleaceae bacterium]
MVIKLEAYEGPFDLLLKLIKKNEFDIYALPIARVTHEYMEAIAALPPDMEQMSEFLVMAATLLEIKSKMLLPQREKEKDEPLDDPREALAKQLIAYKQAQELAKYLHALSPMGERLIGRGDRAAISELTEEPPPELVALPQLEQIFADIMRRVESKIDVVRSGYGKMQRERFTVSEKIGFIRKALRSQGRISLSALFANCGSRHEMVVTFLALLEMVRRGAVTAVQAVAFGDVELGLRPFSAAEYGGNVVPQSSSLAHEESPNVDFGEV